MCPTEKCKLTFKQIITPNIHVKDTNCLVGTMDPWCSVLFLFFVDQNFRTFEVFYLTESRE